MIVDTIPIDAYSWTFGAAVLLFVGIRGFISYRQKANPISQMMGLIGIVAGLALALFGLPLFFLDDPRQIEWLYFIADVMIILLMTMSIYYVWLLVLNKKIPLVLVAVPAVLVAALTIYETVPGAETSFSLVDGTLNSGQISPYYGVLATIFVVLGVYFGRLLFSAENSTTKARLAGLAILYGGVGLALVLDAIVLRSDTDGSSMALLIGALVLLFGGWFFVVGRKK